MANSVILDERIREAQDKTDKSTTQRFDSTCDQIASSLKGTRGSFESALELAMKAANDAARLLKPQVNERARLAASELADIAKVPGTVPPNWVEYDPNSRRDSLEHSMEGCDGSLKEDINHLAGEEAKIHALIHQLYNADDELKKESAAVVSLEQEMKKALDDLEEKMGRTLGSIQESLENKKRNVGKVGKEVEAYIKEKKHVLLEKIDSKEKEINEAIKALMDEANAS